MKIQPTWAATIYVGTRVGYTDEFVTDDRICAWLQDYVDLTGFCVTLTPTEFIYTKGREPGFAIGIINYPRFPSTPEALKARALAIAHGLMFLAKQRGVSVVMSDETIWINEEEDK